MDLFHSVLLFYIIKTGINKSCYVQNNNQIKEKDTSLYKLLLTEN